MRILYLTLLIIISFTTSIKANEKDQTIDILKRGGNLIFIRHAYAPGGGDPENFNINNCNTQRNLNYDGKKQSVKIGKLFLSNEIPIDEVLSSNWCRCKDTAKLAFKNYKTINFLNSFFSAKFAHNRKQQMKDLKNYVKNWDGNKNLVLVTHYVVITEALGYAPSSGEIVVSDKNFNKIGSIEIEY
ncbi:histidine phosphatase family protein [Candidatus Pelagibacter sp.]|uniref:histidine phosphatase family protein n=1 Tax=Candidatus Pelagibacter sp. TaxID=2024849 RepID=UPI003F87C5DD